jgi:predicted nucleic acid-binding protein
MILSDTDILSALAKVDKLELLYSLLGIEGLYVVPSVLQELETARNKKFAFAELIFSHIATQRILVTIPTAIESTFASTLPHTLGAGERESLAVAAQRKAVLLSNESRVAHWSRQLKVKYLDFSFLLRAFWIEGVLTQDEVRQLIGDLYIQDRMRISAKSLAAIFTP